MRHCPGTEDSNVGEKKDTIPASMAVAVEWEPDNCLEEYITAHPFVL